MTNNFDNFELCFPVKLFYGRGSLARLSEIVESYGFFRGVLICDKLFVKNGVASHMIENCKKIVAVYSDVTPSPRLSEIVEATNVLRESRADYAIALGGGSSLDLAKFACSYLYAEDGKTIEDYFYKRAVFTNKHLPLIAIPTTGGTGSEVTRVSVCTDEKSNVKAPTNCMNFYPTAAIVDGDLTLSVPKFVTATTGLDALSHALEAFWSIKHQPISDLFAVKACKLVMENLERAYDDGSDADARSNQMLGSLYAGLAFSVAQTAGVHASSYALSDFYGLSHGEACAFSLDAFMRLNNDARLENLSREIGFENTEAFIAEVRRLKKKFNLKTTMEEIGGDANKIAKACVDHPIMKNNPVPMDEAKIAALFASIK